MNQIVQFFLKVRNSRFFNGIVIFVIIGSAIYAGVSSYDLPEEYVGLLNFLDTAITVFFLVEIIIRIVAERSIIKFFKGGWNVFDFIIVTVSLIPITGGETAFVARLLRIVRVLRIITVVPALKKIVDALFETLPRVGFVALLMFIFIYIWAAIGTLVFGTTDPEHWGNIGLAMLTLAQVATYDDWAAVMKDIIEVFPWVWIYFISFILLNAVIMLNMVIGIIVDVMSKKSSSGQLSADENQ